MARKVAAAIWVEASSLKPWARNPRKNEVAVPDVAASILEFGWGNPILARKANSEVIAGHTRLKALRFLKANKRVEDDDGSKVWVPRSQDDPPFVLPGAPGPGMVPCRVLDLTEEQAHRLALADNRTGELADWDDDTLGKLLAEWKDAEIPLDDMGWTGDQIQALIDGPSEVRGHRRTRPGDRVPDVQDKVHSKIGEVYELGPHRLVCGDSTKSAIWALAMLAGELADAFWSDPPYGVKYVGGTGMTIQNDDLSPKALETLLRDSLGQAFEHCRAGAAWYVASATKGPQHHAFGVVLNELEVWRWSLIWLKDNFVLGRSDHHHRHEPIFYGWKPGAAHYFIDDRTIDTIFEHPKPARSELHPTMKPISLVVEQLKNSTQKGWVVVDPFGGSGTTLMACADLGLVCRTIEIDPVYCDQIRRRYTLWALENDIDPGPGALTP